MMLSLSRQIAKVVACETASIKMIQDLSSIASHCSGNELALKSLLVEEQDWIRESGWNRGFTGSGESKVTKC